MRRRGRSPGTSWSTADPFRNSHIVRLALPCRQWLPRKVSRRLRRTTAHKGSQSPILAQIIHKRTDVTLYPSSNRANRQKSDEPDKRGYPEDTYDGRGTGRRETDSLPPQRDGPRPRLVR